ncbi:MAG: Eco57I restriction-modification methylase domain-containing protein, partial [Eubacteriales bacterium]
MKKKLAIWTVIGAFIQIYANELKKLVGESEYFFYKRGFETAKGTVDVYVYFFELGHKLIKENAFLCYITPNRYLSANYGSALRAYMVNNFKFIFIGDYSNVKVFSEASTYPVVTLISKKINLEKKYTFSSFTFMGENNNFAWRRFESDYLNYLDKNILGFILSSKFEISKYVIENSEPLLSAG